MEWISSRCLKPETIALMEQNHVGESMLGALQEVLGLGFGVIRDDTEKIPSPGSDRTDLLGRIFSEHISLLILPLDLIAVFMTQKLPHGDDYAIALNRYVYAALQ